MGELCCGSESEAGSSSRCGSKSEARQSLYWLACCCLCSSPSHSPTSDPIDLSPAAQLARIEATFEAANKPLAELRHPTKPHLRAVEAYDVLPDEETWATELAVFRFADPPGRGAGRVSALRRWAGTGDRRGRMSRRG